ncbi:hypothetical protein SH449x_002381 [Pirellulaceae bacterium SH449]
MQPIKRRIGWVGPETKVWSWVLDHLPDVERISRVAQWQPDSERDLLLVAADSRVSSEWEELESILATPNTKLSNESPSPKKSRKKSSSAKPAVAVKTTHAAHAVHSSSAWLLLGESWIGHRRTFPLPESLQSFYWYELFDRLLPALDLHEESGSDLLESPAGERGLRVARWIALGERFRNREWKNNRVVVVADSTTTQQMWRETLQDQFGSVLGVDHCDFGRFRFQPDTVLIDFDPPPSRHLNPACDAVSERITDALQAARDRFPDAMRVVASNFPRWNDWERWSESGADVLIPKPGCLYGLAWCMQRWTQQAVS